MELTASRQIPYFGGPWFMSPFFDRILAEKDLDPETEALVRSLAENGYVVLDDLDLDDVDATVDEVIAEVMPLHQSGKYNRIMDAWTACPTVRALATNRRVNDLLELIFGRRPIPFQTLNFLRGSQQATHSDAYHFHCYPKHFMCGVWVALEDITEDNGPLHYYPGSHMLPDYDAFCPHRGKEMNAFIQEMVPAYGLEKERAHLKRGQALIWAANLLHGGDPVGDPSSTRLTQVTHYYFEDCTYYTPFRSDFARGKVYFRRIVDVGTGKLQPLRSSDGRVHPPLLSRLVTARRRAERMLGRGYVRYPT